MPNLLTASKAKVVFGENKVISAKISKIFFTF